MINIDIINMLGIAVIANMWTHWFTPIQGYKDGLVNVLERFLPVCVFKNVTPFFYCSKCFSFWLGLILFLSLPVAAVVSLLGFIINFIIDYINYFYEQ